MSANKNAEGSASDEAHVVFPDPGFHIAVLGALMDEKLVDEERIKAKLEGVPKGEDEEARLLSAMARLHAVALDREEVARIERVDFDGGNDVYMLLEEGAGVDTGGEDDTYELRSLEGIEALSGLENLNLDGHGYRAEVLDLGPLKGHPSLSTLFLTGDCSNAAVLETLPKLAKVNVQYAKVDDPGVLERLEARGVEVRRAER